VSHNESGAPRQRDSAKCRSRPVVDGDILTDRTVSTRDHRRRQIARLAERVSPLARYYRHHGGPLLAVPIGDYYVVGRWAA
jgi:hypothetical protein